MADPVSLLGTLPALVSLPAVLLQAIQTLQGFSSSVKNASSDVAQLLEDLETMLALILRCLSLSATDVPAEELQLWTKICSSLKDRIDALTVRLSKLQTELTKPSITNKNVKARIQKYLSEPYIEGERKCLSEQKDTLSLLFHSLQRSQLNHISTGMTTMRRVQETMKADQEQILRILHQQQNPSASSGPTDTTSLIAPATDRKLGVQRRTRTKASRCALGLCGCRCHRLKFNTRSWFVSGATECLVACGCDDRFYQWTVSAFGTLFTIHAGFRKAGETCISWSLTPKTTVPYTSIGFQILEECRSGKLTVAEASHEVVKLRDRGIISTKDVNPDGQGYVDYLIRAQWGVDDLIRRQCQLLELLAREGFLSDGDKLLTNCLGWVGEGAHMFLLKKLLGLTDSLAEVGPEMFSSWPTPFDLNFRIIYTYPDCFFVEMLSHLANSDPGFGGLTELHEAVLSNNIDLAQKLLNYLPQPALLARNVFGQCALHLAVRNPEMVKALIRAGVEKHVNEQDKHGVTPLMYAAAYGELESTKALLLAGADPYQLDGLHRICMWHYTLFCNKSEYLQEILEFYTDRFQYDAVVATNLCLCIRMVMREAYIQDMDNRTLRFLLQAAPLPEDSTINGTPLIHLCNNSEEALLILQQYTGPMNVENPRGYYPLMVFAHYREAFPVLQVSIDKGADPNLTDKHGMNALHHLKSSRARHNDGNRGVEEWIAWMNAAAVLLHNQVDINHGDRCECPCSPNGCSPIRAFFWAVRSTHSSKSAALQSIPWFLELVLILKSTQSDNSIKSAIASLHRLQVFEEFAMKHTCCIHDARLYVATRPKVAFHCPRNDLLYGITEQRCDDWEDEAREINEEQDELIHQLEDECSAFWSSLGDTIEKKWTDVLARQVVLLEHKLSVALHAKMEQPKRGAEKKPPAEDIISEMPLEYVDRKRDRFVHPPLAFGLYDSLRPEHCRAEHHLDQFLAHFSGNGRQYEYMKGWTAQAWSAQRVMMVEDLMEEIGRLRSVRMEDRNWNVSW